MNSALVFVLFALVAGDMLEEDSNALNLIQGHARKIIKGKARKGAPAAAALSADDAFGDLEGGGLSLMQGSQNRISAHGSCSSAQGVCKVSKKKAAKMDPALFAAVADGVEDSFAALALFQKMYPKKLKGDECGSRSERMAAADDATTDEAADSAATVSLLQQEGSKIRSKKANAGQTR
mmetsp:Transcript_88833/g.157417  ORF Transcript_88833/g.157417 Transcript_88833/m.157417 type:complete len:179 (-) Transcript_88833:187-723(-)